MKNKIIGFMLFYCLCINANAQQGNRLFSGEIENISFINYPENTLIKATINSQNEAISDYPTAGIYSKTLSWNYPLTGYWSSAKKIINFKTGLREEQ